MNKADIMLKSGGRFTAGYGSGFPPKNEISNQVDFVTRNADKTVTLRITRNSGL